MQSFELIFSAAIPVGHRVDMRWYKTPRVGLVSGTTFESHPHAPVVVDLDTGIVYCAVEPFWEQGAMVSVPRRKPLALQRDLVAGAQLEYQFAGRVVACRVATYSPQVKDIDVRIQTTLVVAPEA